LIKHQKNCSYDEDVDDDDAAAAAIVIVVVVVMFFISPTIFSGVLLTLQKS
jgi:hypothetical protein